MRIKVDKPIAVSNDGAILLLDEMFYHRSDFYGVTATELRPVTKAEIDETVTIDNAEERFEDCWRESVAHGGCTDSLREYATQIVQHGTLEDFFDWSEDGKREDLQSALAAVEFDDIDSVEFFECIGCGRMLNDAESRKYYSSNDWTIFDAELWRSVVVVEDAKNNSGIGSGQ